MDAQILISDLSIESLQHIALLLSSSDLLRLLSCGSPLLRINLLNGGITTLYEAAQGSTASWKLSKTNPAETILPLLAPGSLCAFSVDSCPMRTKCLLTLNTMHSRFESDWFCRKDWLPLLPASLTYLRLGLFPFNNILSLTYAKYELEEDATSEEGATIHLKSKVAPSLSERFPNLLTLIIDTQTAKHIYYQGTEEYTWDYNYGFRLEMPRSLTHLDIPLICVHASFCASLSELTQLETLKLFVSLKRRCSLLSSPIPHGPPISWSSIFNNLTHLRVFGLGKFLLRDSELREMLQSVPSHRAQTLEIKALSLTQGLMRAIPIGLTRLEVEITCLSADTFHPRGGFFPPTLTVILMTVREVKEDMLDLFASKWTGGLPRGLKTMTVRPPWPTPTPLCPALHLSQHCIQSLPPALEFLILPFKVVWDANIYSFFDLEKRAALRALLPQLRHFICNEMPANEMRNLTSIESLCIEQRLEPPLFPHHFEPLSRLRILILGPAISSSSSPSSSPTSDAEGTLHRHPHDPLRNDENATSKSIASVAPSHEDPSSSSLSPPIFNHEDFILEEDMVRALPAALEILVLPDLIGTYLPPFLRCLYLYHPSSQLQFLLQRDSSLLPLNHLELLDIRCSGKGDDFFACSAARQRLLVPDPPPLDDASPEKNISIRRSSDYVSDMSQYSSKVVESAHKRLRRQQSKSCVDTASNHDSNHDTSSSFIGDDYDALNASGGRKRVPTSSTSSQGKSRLKRSKSTSSSSRGSESTHSGTFQPTVSSTILFPSLPRSLLILRLPSIAIPSIDDFMLLPPNLIEISFSAPVQPSTKAAGKHKAIPFDNALPSLYAHPQSKSLLCRLPTTSIIHKLERLQCQDATVWCSAPSEKKGSFFPSLLSLETWIYNWHQHTHSEIELTYLTHMNVPWYLSK